VFFAVHGPMLDHSEDPRSPSTCGCLASNYSGRRLKLRVSYTRLTWGLAKRCAEIQQLLGSAHIASSPVRTESPLRGISGYSRTGLSSYRLTASRRRQPGQRGEPRHHAVRNTGPIRRASSRGRAVRDFLPSEAVDVVSSRSLEGCHAVTSALLDEVVSREALLSPTLRCAASAPRGPPGTLR
jgi:hypothetical protein